MNGRTAIAAFVLVTCTLATPYTVNGQELEIGIIDLYGLSRVPARQVRATLTFTEGDTIAFGNGKTPAVLTESEERLARAPDIARARIRPVCCDGGRAIVYVGIEERGAAAMRFRAEPEGDARLAADIVRAGDEAENALRRAVLRGDTGEDSSQGHSMVDDPATRAIQERFVLPSPVWTDRNKAAGALMALSTDREPELLATLREQALAPLVEMARWNSEGHALPAFFVLGRIAGYSDEAVYDLWERGNRDAVIDAARSGSSTPISLAQ